MKKFEEITISDPSILDYPATQRILNNLEKYNLLPKDFENPKVPKIIDAISFSHKLALEALKAPAPQNHVIAQGKRILHLTTHPGTFIKQCPGTNNMLCCHYHIINMVSNCPYDCTYCYLQTYLNQPLMTFYVNEEDILKQVRDLCIKHESQSQKNLLRIGTGELSDSLAQDPITEFSENLAQTMSEFKNVRLELKTKSKNVEHLFKLPKKDHVIIGWSMNPPEIINHEEHETARFEERLRAAIMCAQQGFGIAFHFDPMIYTENWKTLYTNTVKILLKAIPHEQIRWISIGGLRYQPQLKPIALKRHPETKLFVDETILSDDGKTRYLRTLRTEMFQFLNQTIKTLAPQVYTYLCMESKPVWEKALGRLPDREF